jgi:hypothetical protein
MNPRRRLILAVDGSHRTIRIVEEPEPLNPSTNPNVAMLSAPEGDSGSAGTNLSGGAAG